MDKLKFSFGNSKMVKLASYLGVAKKQVSSFDIPAGHTCPAASLCLSMADKVTGKITDGKDAQFRCYAASSEAAFKNTRLLRWHNFDLLKSLENSIDGMVELIENSLPKNIRVVRVHSSGDFFHKNYFQAWVRVAKNHPEIHFFGYTKILNYVNADKSDNFRLVYSFGGKMDAKVSNEPVAYVVNTPADGQALGLPVSCLDNPVDDFDYVMAGKSFALSLHGTQPKKAHGLIAEGV